MAGDPYRALLDVRDLRRPPNAYALLGLNDFETDAEKIDRAIRTRRSILMQRQRGTPPMIWQRISQELDQAVTMLSDPQQKSAYDQKLSGGTQSGSDNPSKNGSSNGAAVANAAGKSGVELPGNLACPACGTAYPSGRKFCGSCGQTLIESCVGCGAQTFVEERFCGSCGVDLEEACTCRGKAAQREMSRAAKLNDEGRFQEALGIVKPIAELQSRRLAEISTQARELAEEIANRRDQSKSRVDAAVAQAIKAIDHHRWKEAVEAIEHIPALLRKKEHQELLAQAQQAVDDLNFLNQEIRQAIKQDQTLHLLPKVEHVLQLDPDNERMVKLADKLRSRYKHDVCRQRDLLMAQARTLLKEHQYQQACELLEQVSQDAANDEVAQLHDQLKELAYLWDSLRHSPTVDQTLVALGGRLLKLSPGDQRLATICSQLKERSQKQKRNPLEAIAWARAPQETAVGPPIERLVSFGRINIDKVAENGLFVENAPRLYAACGAALEGLGLAEIETNLLPKPDGGMLGSLRSWVKRPGRVDAAWGIDLSSSALKAIKLVRSGKDADPTIDAFDLVEHATLLGSVTSEAPRRDVIAETLKKFVQRNAIKDEAVCLVYPGRLVLRKFFQAPPIEEKKMGELMQYEARQQVPFPLDQLAWDYHAWQRAKEDAQLPRDVMLMATKRHHAMQHLSAFEDVDIRAGSLQCDCVALCNFYQYAVADPTNGKASGERPEKRSAVMLLDVGADAMNCVVCGDQTIWFRSFPRGSDEFNKALMRRFEVSFATAEQLKHNPAKARRISNLHEAWGPSFAQLLKDVRDSITAYEDSDSGRPIHRIWACGGGFRIHGLHRYLLG